jgi:hypothetical protein
LELLDYLLIDNARRFLYKWPPHKIPRAQPAHFLSERIRKMKKLLIPALLLCAFSSSPAHAIFPTVWKCTNARDQEGYEVKKEHRLMDGGNWYSIISHFGSVLDLPESKFEVQNGSRQYFDDGGFASILSGGVGPHETHTYVLSESIFQGEQNGTLEMGGSTNFGSGSEKYDCSQE